MRAPRPVSPVTAMLLADARTPVGGNVNSAGLEPALQAGMPAGEIRAYIGSRLRTSATVEAGVAVVTRNAVLTASDDDLPRRIDLIEDHWAARTPSLAQREASRLLARGYLRLAKAIWPDPALDTLEARTPRASRGVVVGAITGVTGLAAADTVRLIFYEEAQSIAAAFMKLHPADPAVAAGWVRAACDDIESTVSVLADLTDPAAIPDAGGPQNEAWAQAHALSTERLFRA